MEISVKPEPKPKPRPPPNRTLLQNWFSGCGGMLVCCAKRELERNSVTNTKKDLEIFKKNFFLMSFKILITFNAKVF